MPTGTAVLTLQPDWRRFAVSDCGCGMRLLRGKGSPTEVTQVLWNELADHLRANKGGLGDLGGGNHFLDAMASVLDDGHVYFLIHTGSRSESGLVDAHVANPERFDAEFDRVVDWARQNRARVHEVIDGVFGPSELVLDLPHNTYERLEGGGAIIRKGAVHVRPGDTMIIPSHMSGDAVLLQATSMVEESLFSMSHGTGRKMSRGDSKALADQYDFASLRKRLLLPAGLDDASLRTEGPYAYRDLDDCLAMIAGYVEEVDRLTPFAYMGHL